MATALAGAVTPPLLAAAATAALAWLKPVLAAANGAGTDGYSVATVGQAPPGSTFKVATSLALLRAGLDPDSRVTCPGRVVVDGKPFVNYSDYPSGSLGSIGEARRSGGLR